jgi:hypothetical protein
MDFGPEPFAQKVHDGDDQPDKRRNDQDGPIVINFSNLRKNKNGQKPFLFAHTGEHAAASDDRSPGIYFW